jgi:hypothetical protein
MTVALVRGDISLPLHIFLDVFLQNHNPEHSRNDGGINWYDEIHNTPKNSYQIAIDLKKCSRILLRVSRSEKAEIKKHTT